MNEIQNEEREKNYNPLTDPESMGGGGNVQVPDCFFCKNSKGPDCLKLQCKKSSAPIDIFDCPYRENKDDTMDRIGGIFGFNK